jgi:hypothetical protein
MLAVKLDNLIDSEEKSLLPALRKVLFACKRIGKCKGKNGDDNPKNTDAFGSRGAP